MNRYEWLNAYLLAKPGVATDYKAEWGWQRYRVDERMFAATCFPGENHANVESRELISLKCDPLRAEALRTAFADVIPGFYCDKRNWNSIYLDGEVPDDLLRELCDESYRLVVAKLSKKRQKELGVLPSSTYCCSSPSKSD